MKANENQMISLLDRLAGQLGCYALSDLRMPEYRNRIHDAIADIPVEEFPLLQWKDAAVYLTGECRDFEDAREVKGYLMSL